MKIRALVVSFLFLFSLLIAGSAIAVDTDGDGLEDTWETEHGLDPNNATDGQGAIEDTSTGITDANDDGVVDGKEDEAKKTLKSEILEEDHNLFVVFMATAIISFSVFCLLAGVFTAYFGAGKSRVIGIVLTLVGVVGLFGFLYIKVIGKVDSVVGLVNWSQFHTVYSLMIVLGALVGAVASIGVFLVSIMKA